MFGIPAEAFGLMAAAGILIDLGIVIAVGHWARWQAPPIARARARVALIARERVEEE